MLDVLDHIGFLLQTTQTIPSPVGDFAVLRAFIKRQPSIVVLPIWSKIVRLALELPTHFPSGQLPILSPGYASNASSFSRREVASLLAHQFLGTMRRPFWGDDDEDCNLGVWFHSSTSFLDCETYLRELFSYFEGLDGDDGGFDRREIITYRLITSDHRYDNAISAASLTPMQIKLFDQDTSTPAGGAVGSSNRSAGFGMSAKRKRITVGCAPDISPAVLITPPLGKDQVFVVEGVRQGGKTLGRGTHFFSGRLEDRLDLGPKPASEVDRLKDPMVFMGALDIDLWDLRTDESGLQDLRLEYMDGVIQKGILACSSGSYEALYYPLIRPHGASYSDLLMDMVAIWCAASITTKRLVVMLDRSWYTEILATRLESLVSRLSAMNVASVTSLLGEMPRYTNAVETHHWVNNMMGEE